MGSSDAAHDRTPSDSTAAPAAAADPVRIHLTASAVDAIREMLEEEELLGEGGLRISAHFGAGCATPLRYGLILEPEAEEDDVVLTGEGGIRIFLDPRNAWTLDGLRVDYVDSPDMGSGFAFRHPRGTPGRAC